eukprot:m.7895 g.7895  ORF g.7895 m.7895 type:complete len:197 (+) comp5327_c0_seq1:127-717(+)
MEGRSPGSKDAHVLYMGLMMKRGALRKNWTLRWFEITSTHLVYFKFSKDTDYAAQVKGVIKLSDCLNVYRGKDAVEGQIGWKVSWPEGLYPPAREKKNVLALKTKRRTYFFVAPTREAAKHWETILRQSCSEVKPSFSSGTPDRSFLRDTSQPYDRRMTMSKMGVEQSLAGLEEELEVEDEFLDTDSLDGDTRPFS